MGGWVEGWVGGWERQVKKGEGRENNDLNMLF